MRGDLGLSSRLLLAIVDDRSKLLDQLLVLLAGPGVVGAPDSILHLLEGLLEHLSEVGVHLVDVLGQLLYFLFLLRLVLVLLILDLLLLLHERVDLVRVLLDPLVQLRLLLA